MFHKYYYFNVYDFISTKDTRTFRISFFQRQFSRSFLSFVSFGFVESHAYQRARERSVAGMCCVMKRCPSSSAT